MGGVKGDTLSGTQGFPEAPRGGVRGSARALRRPRSRGTARPALAEAFPGYRAMRTIREWPVAAGVAVRGPGAASGRYRPGVTDRPRGRVPGPLPVQEGLMLLRRIVPAAMLVALGLAVLFVPRREHWEQHGGQTMGTYFRVVWHSTARAGESDALRARIDAALEAVDAQMSTYRPDSEIRRFAAAPSGEWFAVSKETEAVVQAALELARITGGAYDPTVAPLVGLWGFGPEGRRRVPPDSAAIEAARDRVGWQWIETRASPPALRRHRAEVALDLSSIAKGHGVDRLAQVLEDAGADRFLVEIGGEVVARGFGPNGRTWRIALERPEGRGDGQTGGGSGRGGGEPAPGGGALASREDRDGGQTDRRVAPAPPTDLVLAIADGAVATSGTYRNAFIADGQRHSHIIDPRSGRPVVHPAVQVTVVATDCQSADGRATALLVLGPDAGRRLAEEQGWAARFLIMEQPPTEGSPWIAVETAAFRQIEVIEGRSDTGRGRSDGGGDE